MARAGRRYPLVVYTRLMDRWRSPVFVLGLALFGLAWALYSWGFETWRWLGAAGVGGFCLLLSLLLLLARKSAYVQANADHLRLATPFLGLNISYRRFLRSTSATMGLLFPPTQVPKALIEVVRPVAQMTAIVIELRGFPMPARTLRTFLSPLFFKDETPHLVILVEDWMKFNAELESMRVGGGPAPDQPARRRDQSILSRLPNKNE